MVVDPKGIWIPEVDGKLCNRCGLCYQSCAGHAIDFKKHNLSLFGSLPGHPEIGNFKAIYAGYSLDDALRWKSQSGGIATTILIHLLSQGAISGAVVTRWNPTNPLLAETFIARTPDEIIQAVGSKYCPVPTGEIIRKILETDEKFAFVGIPCKIHSLRKAEALLPKLKKRIYIHVGLYCLNVNLLYYQDYFIRRLRLKPLEITSFAYRSKSRCGWPGELRIELSNGEVHSVPQAISRFALRPYFSAWRCQLCVDKLNELADISLGDCRIARHYQKETLDEAAGSNNPGKSDIIARTVLGHQLIRDIDSAGLIKIEETKWEEILFTTGVSEKKLGFRTFTKISKLLGWGVPEYGLFYEPEQAEDRAIFARKSFQAITLIIALRYPLCNLLVRFPWYRWIFRKVPISILQWINAYSDRYSAYTRLRNSRLKWSHDRGREIKKV